MAVVRSVVLFLLLAVITLGEWIIVAVQSTGNITQKSLSVVSLPSRKRKIRKSKTLYKSRSFPQIIDFKNSCIVFTQRSFSSISYVFSSSIQRTFEFFTRIQSNEHASISNKTVTFHLGDKVPIQINAQAMGGNGMNVSVGLKRLGQDVSFYTYVGPDKFSSEIEGFLKDEKIEVLAEKDSQTSDISFILDIADDRVIFSHHPVRNHTFKAPLNSNFDLIFLSSIGNHWEEAYRKVLDYSQYSQIPIAFSPGSRQLTNLTDTFFSVLHNSRYLLINTEEAREILEHFGTEFSDVPSLMKGLAKLGPTIVSLTDGGKGAYAYDGSDVYHIGTFSSDKTPEKTGAGDAYASGFLAGFSQTNKVEEAMRWGSINAHMVMQEIGAQNGLQTQEKMLQILHNHDTFKATKLT